jgi:SAM-dependent methyltransferase
MNQLVRRYINKVSNTIYDQVIKKSTEKDRFVDSIAFRVALESFLHSAKVDQPPLEIFHGISDDFWLWLHTEGIKRNSDLKEMLPGLPEENIQELFTSYVGDKALEEAFYYYKLFKEAYKKHKGNISLAENILDFGCGWGRIIRFFIKDIEQQKLWGCDPAAEVVQWCNLQSKWWNFEYINPYPPTIFADNTFDFIYSFSVFSHLSEEFHLNLLSEIRRILKPGGIYVTTTRNREAIQFFSESSSVAKNVDGYDHGEYCHYNFHSKKWPYWGETAISRQYVADHWTNQFRFLEYLENNIQNVIIVQK